MDGGMESAVAIDRDAKIWRVEARIPLASISDSRTKSWHAVAGKPVSPRCGQRRLHRLEPDAHRHDAHTGTVWRG